MLESLLTCSQASDSPFGQLLRRFPSLFFLSTLKPIPLRFDASSEGAAPDYATAPILSDGDMQLTQRLEGCTSPPPLRENGVDIYPSVRSGVDSIVIRGDGWTEEFLHVDVGNADPFVYWVSVQGCDVRFVRGTSLEVADGEGKTLARMDPVRYWRAGEFGEGREARTQVDLLGVRDARITISIPEEDHGSEILLDPQWNLTVRRGAARYGHTATLLSDGRVLVVGGFGPQWAGGRAEIFEPSTGTWTPTRPMIRTRAYHTATLLPDGLVLVVGGFGPILDEKGVVVGFGALRHCELFDPRSGSWIDVDPMAQVRVFHTATCIPRTQRFDFLNGVRVEAPADVVLVAGGAGGNGGLPSACEIFDSGTWTWRTAADLHRPRALHTATLVSGDRVWIAGGVSPTGILDACEVYDANQDRWFDTASLSRGRMLHTATAMRNGKVLVVGGIGNGPVAPGLRILDRAEEFDPSTNLWSDVPTANRDGTEGHSATLLPSGRVLIAGGIATDGTRSGLYRGWEEYDPDRRTWSAAAMTELAATPRALHSATLLPSGDVLLAGGLSVTARGGLVLTSSTEIYRPLNGSWRQGLQSTEPYAYEQALYQTLLPNGSVLLVFRDGSSQLYDPSTDAVQATGSLGVECPWGGTLTLLNDGRVLLAGGDRFSSGAVAECRLYDPSMGVWNGTTSLNVRRALHTATLLSDGRVLVAGGSQSFGTVDLTSCEIFDPTAATWTAAGSMAQRRFSHSAALLPDGRVIVMAGDFEGILARRCEIFDLATRRWSLTAPVAVRYRDPRSAVMPAGNVLILGSYEGPARSCSLYEPTWQSAGSPWRGAWRTTGATRIAHSRSAAVLLPNGKLLMAGGGTAASEIYLPATELWATVASLPHLSAVAYPTLLPNGQVLLSGAEYLSLQRPFRALYEDTGSLPAWRPLISRIDGESAFPVALRPGASIVVSGERFRGVSAGGDGTSNSSEGNHPILRLVSFPRSTNEGAGRQWTLSEEWWTGTTILANLPSAIDAPEGYYMLFVVVDGVVGEGRVVRLTQLP